METQAKPTLSLLNAVDRMIKHFSQPGAKLAWDAENKKCKYRLSELRSDPIRCAMGVLIPDDKYEPGMENAFATGVIDCYDLGFTISQSDRKFIDSLQMLHDNCARRGGNADELVTLLRGFRAALVPETFDVAGRMNFNY